MKTIVLPPLSDTEIFGLKVIVDSSPNSINDSLLSTKRARVIELTEMTRDMVWKIPELKDLFATSRRVELDNILWAVLGGNPADYIQMWALLRDEFVGEDQVNRAISVSTPAANIH
jgi:hypothetical protein